MSNKIALLITEVGFMQSCEKIISVYCPSILIYEIDRERCRDFNEAKS